MIFCVAVAAVDMGHHALGIGDDHHGNGCTAIAAAFWKPVVEQAESVHHVPVFVREKRETDLPELGEPLNGRDVIGRKRDDFQAQGADLFDVFVPDDSLVNAGRSPRQRAREEHNEALRSPQGLEATHLVTLIRHFEHMRDDLARSDTLGDQRRDGQRLAEL